MAANAVRRANRSSMKRHPFWWIILGLIFGHYGGDTGAIVESLGRAAGEVAGMQVNIR